MTANPTETEFDRLDPENRVVTLQSGLQVEVLPLKTRQFFKLARIITHGGMNVLEAFLNNTEFEDEDAFASQLLGLVIFAVPEAGDQAIEFIQSMCAPSGLTGDRKGDKEKWTEYSVQMANPNLEDALSIIEVVIKTEGPELRALGNRLAATVRSMSSLQDNKEPQTSPEPQTPELEVIKGLPSSEDSAEPTT